MFISGSALTQGFVHSGSPTRPVSQAFSPTLTCSSFTSKPYPMVSHKKTRPCNLHTLIYAAAAAPPPDSNNNSNSEDSFEKSFDFNSSSSSNTNSSSSSSSVASTQPSPILVQNSTLTAPSDAQLQEIRSRYRTLERRLQRFLKEEKYMDAARIRDQLKALREKDPLMSYEDSSKELEEAVKEQDFKRAAILRDRINQLKLTLPQFGLDGLWAGMFGSRGIQHVRIVTTGDKLVATKTKGDQNVPAGKVSFEVDLSRKGMSQPDDNNPLDAALKAYTSVKVLHKFKGRGQIAEKGFVRPRWVDGEFILFENGSIAFVWLPLSFMVTFDRLNKL